MLFQDALVLVFARNAFYKRLHFLVLAALTLAIITIISLMVVIYYLAKHPTRPLYFATDNIGRLIKITPLDTPIMSNDDVMNWTIEGLEKAFSYDYVNYRSQLQNAQKYFTTFGWTNYMKALTDSNNLVALTARKMIMIAKIVDRPKIIQQGKLSGAYAWKFQMPMLVTSMLPPFDDKSKFSNAWILTALVQQQQVLQSYKGLGIVQVIVVPAASASAPPPQEVSVTPPPS